MKTQNIKKQIKMEQDAFTMSKKTFDENFTKNVEKKNFSQTEVGSTILKVSVEKIADKIIEFMLNNQVQSVVKDVVNSYFQKKEYELAYSILSTLINNIAAGNNTVSNLSKKVYEDVEMVILMGELENDKPLLLKNLDNNKNRSGWDIAKQKKNLAKAHHQLNIESKNKLKIGLTLITIVQAAGIELFNKPNLENGEHKKAELNFTENIVPVITSIRDKMIKLQVKYRPLIVEPLDWTDIYDNGGYYTDNVLSFAKHSKIDYRVHKIIENYDLTRMFNIINNIQKTKWSVNKKVLEVVDYIIDKNIVDPSTPKINPKLFGDIPVSIDIDAYKMCPPNYDEEKKGDKQRWYKEYLEIKDYSTANKSNRLTYYLTLDIARDYSKYEHFYFSYNTDFRGRLYAIQQLFNPQTTGKVKALLQFAEGQKLNVDGLYWLKIHIANCFGKDKDNYEERIKWFDTNEQMIIALGRNPLDNLKYMGDEDPLMFLAGCFAYCDYLDDKEVKLPLALDATCSGIQIYSGLLLDKVGGESVNVIGNNRNDIYQQVANEANRILVEKEHPHEYKRKTELKKGEFKEEIKSTYQISKHFENKINRKLVKRNVMTTPYSVSKRGMFFQIKEILDDQKAKGKSMFYEGEEGLTLQLLTDVNEKAIKNVVKGAKIGQDFLVDVTNKLLVKRKKNKDEDKPIIWTTPMGFPVVQWYQKDKNIKIRTGLTQLTIKQKTNNINKIKQKAGIAPNFIHSLDAALLYMTVENLQKMGINDIMLIHDSFSVLPNDVARLNLAFREAYIELFKSKPLEEFIKQIHPESLEDAKKIYINDLNLDEVMDSGYIIS